MKLIPAPQARAEYLGNINHSTLWRWEKALPDFPKPVRIGTRKYFRVSDLEAFLASRQY